MLHWLHWLHWFTPDHILALIAIACGAVAIVYERQLHGSFETQKQKIEEIVLSVHTSYVGKFPEHLERTTELIGGSKADDELRILVDFLGYGIYSDPERYQRYVKALDETVLSRVRVLIYDEASAKATLEMQFKREDFAQLKETKTFQHYLERYKRLIRTDPSRYENFLNSLVAVQDRFCQQLTANPNIHVRSISAASIGETVFFWMVAKKEMIFAFPNSYSGRKEFAFKTRDDHLIDVFADQFDQKWKLAKEVQDRCYDNEKLFSSTAAPLSKGSMGDYAA